MATIFDPEVLHDVCRRALDRGSTPAILDAVIDELAVTYPEHIRRDVPWLFNNAGGAMGQMKLLHCSLSEYILVFGTPIGTEGHSGRYLAEVHDFMLAGEMWCFTPGDVDRAVFRPGDAAYLGSGLVKGYRIPDQAFMLEYARGPIPTMLPFGLADSLLSTLDRTTIARTLWHYGRLATASLLRGKI